MKLFSLNKGKLEVIKVDPFKLERDIQNLIEDNTGEVFNIEFVSSEFKIGDFRIDTLCFDKENNSFVIIEYKKGSSYSVIDQGYSYLSMMLNNKSDFILEYNEKSSDNIQRNSVNWSQSRIIFISPSFNSYQKHSVNFKDVPFELWEIKKYSNHNISLNPIISSSKESVKTISNNNDSLIRTVNEEVKVYGLEDLISESTQVIKDIWMIIQRKFDENDFDETRFNYTRNYIRFSKVNNNSVISYFRFRKESINIVIMGGTVYDSGKRKSKNYFELEDYKNLCKKYIKRYKDGKTTQVEYKISIKNEGEINYLISLLKQRHDFLNK